MGIVKVNLRTDAETVFFWELCKKLSFEVVEVDFVANSYLATDNPNAILQSGKGATTKPETFEDRAKKSKNGGGGSKCRTVEKQKIKGLRKNYRR